jgi:hypothetical protein
MDAANPAPSSVALAGRRITTLPPGVRASSLFEEERNRVQRFAKALVSRVHVWVSMLSRAARALVGARQPDKRAE